MASVMGGKFAELDGQLLGPIESLYVTYTKGWSERDLYCLTFVIVVSAYVLGSLPFLILDLLRLPFFERRRLQPRVRNSTESIAKCVKSVLAIFFFIILPIQLTSYPIFQFFGINGSLPLPSGWEILSQLVVFLLVEDYTNYWIHRWLHTDWAYKHIHYMHHEFSAPMGFAASYAHPIEVLALGLPAFLGPALTGCHLVTIWIWFPLRQLEAVETHCGYNLRWWPTKLIPFYGGAEYHDHHHLVGQQSRGNFASIFTICDYIYGTDKGYRTRKRMEAAKQKDL
eukprot:jgi/Mesvir1/26972/Mv20686-RA.1